MATLTERERQIVTLLAGGESQKQIARQLGLKHATVRATLCRARQRTGTVTTAELCCRWAREAQK